MTTIVIDTKLVRTGNGADAVAVPLVPYPWYKKINPLWWLGNEEESAKGNTFYYRYIRNPLLNLRWFVLGVADRPHTVSGKYGNADLPIPNKRSDLRPPESGIQYSVIYVFGIPLLPYFSCSYRHFTFYIGWEPAGGLGLLINFSNSDLK